MTVYERATSMQQTKKRKRSTEARLGNQVRHHRGIPCRCQRRYCQSGLASQAASRGRRRPLLPGKHRRVRRGLPRRLHPHLLPHRPRLLWPAV